MNDSDLPHHDSLRDAADGPTGTPWPGLTGGSSHDSPGGLLPDLPDDLSPGLARDVPVLGAGVPRGLLDGRTFVMVSSTASDVDAGDPTWFEYHEAAGVVWGGYTGGTVIHGRFAGTRKGERVELAYAHALKTGGLAGGRSTSRVQTLPGGRLRLVEEFTFDGDDTPQLSICDEVPRRH
ncbi:hypothetical protein Sme01_07130 [Sphaerisporangium melleum]|uniref:Uncharacterized protein n=1 Tax=Sphaerisporangium melleum TaxID=321316 RepID=A0A917QW83_9ACTN|nr:hypothetical protein [Sphaerisporangium melleum]GGK73212.1 hypothetical protein GCM10007964_15070 [Sphaerisporangium melleum]GII68237.1 hypothetical protein Sme01_07130 [Sphaerisporangium melleum]